MLKEIKYSYGEAVGYSYGEKWTSTPASKLIWGKA